MTEAVQGAVTSGGGGEHGRVVARNGQTDRRGYGEPQTMRHCLLHAAVAPQSGVSLNLPLYYPQHRLLPPLPLLLAVWRQLEHAAFPN